MCAFIVLVSSPYDYSNCSSLREHRVHQILGYLSSISVRAKLDDAAFTKAWAAGGAMTLDQALAEALGGGG